MRSDRRSKRRSKRKSREAPSVLAGGASFSSHIIVAIDTVPAGNRAATGLTRCSRFGPVLNITGSPPCFTGAIDPHAESIDGEGKIACGGFRETLDNAVYVVRASGVL